MRILMLNNEFPPLGGGTGTVNQTLLEHFASVDGLRIDLVTSARGRASEFDNFSSSIRIYKVPVNNRNIHHSSNRELIRFAHRAWPVALNLHRREHYDFALAWSTVPAGALALRLWRFARLPYILRVSGPDIPGFERRYRALYPALTPLIRLIWNEARTVVAKCIGEADLIRRADQRIQPEIIPNGVDIEKFRPSTDFSSDPFKILCVGRLIHRKGQEQVIRALQRLLAAGFDARVSFVGTGDAAREYQEQVQAAGVGDYVEFAGYVPRERIGTYYSNSHAFVLASYNEGMSVATLEAMAAGLPVLVAETGGTAELVDDGRNGYIFEHGDVDALSQHLIRLMEDRALAKKMGNAARLKAEGFPWSEVAKKYMVLFGRTAHPELDPHFRDSARIIGA